MKVASPTLCIRPLVDVKTNACKNIRSRYIEIITLSNFFSGTAITEKRFIGCFDACAKYGVAESDAAKLQMGEYCKLLLGFKTHF